MQGGHIFSGCDHLLAASKVLNVASTFGGLLSLLLQACIMVVLLRDAVLLGVLLSERRVAVRVLEARL
jgi:hypothetical protein